MKLYEGLRLYKVESKSNWKKEIVQRADVKQRTVATEHMGLC